MPGTSSPPVGVVTISGDIDIATSAAMADTLTTALSRGPHLEADLSAVTFMDASGIGVLLTVRAQAVAAGGSLTLRKPSRAVRLLISILDMDEVLPQRGLPGTGTPADLDTGESRVTNLFRPAGIGDREHKQ